MRIESRGIDPATGEPDPHGIPQIACPARREEVNPQFTCRNCPCADRVETHEAVDDLGQPFHVVDAVECTYDGTFRAIPALWQEFPSPLAGVVENALPRVEPGVPCPLLSSPERFGLGSLLVDGVRWVPVGNCLTCQFYRGIEGERTPRSVGGTSGIGIVCAGPVAMDEG